MNRQEMVNEIKTVYSLDSPRVFSAMLEISREEFIPQKSRHLAYDDTPIDIGFGQTISQPYTVAFMTHLLIAKSLNLKAKRVLEVGTGSGYQAAILSKLFKKVYTVEIIPDLADKARKILERLGFKNVEVKTGSGEWGWPEKAPFDAILVTAGVEKIPQKLLDELKVGGVLVAPVGKGMDKEMTRYSKQSKPACAGRFKFRKEEFGIFHFVPFVKEKN